MQWRFPKLSCYHRLKQSQNNNFSIYSQTYIFSGSEISILEPISLHIFSVNPLLKEAYLKLQDTERDSLAMSRIEEAIGLSPSSVKSIIDDIEARAKQEEKEYEDDMRKEKAEINKEKVLLQNDEHLTGDGAKKKIKED